MSKKKQPPKDSQLIVDDPYIFEKCQVDIHLALFPAVDGAQARQAALSITSHGDAPVFAVHEDAEALIENLPAEVRTLLTRFKVELPERHLGRLRRTAESKARKKKKTPSPAKTASGADSEQAEEKTSPKKQLTLLGG